MQTYAKSVDEFSPGIHIAQREVATLDNAVMGGLSADMAGMGAKNLSATAKALRDAGDSGDAGDLDEVLAETRKQEKAITESFNRQKQTFQDILNDVVGAARIKTICSGDDCTAVPKQPLSDHEKQSILKKISEAGYASDFRLSFIPENIPKSSTRSLLAVHGESLEKVLRKNLADKMEPAKLKGLIFGVDMKTTTLNQGGVKLLTATSPSVRLSERERQLINENFKKALEQFNQELSQQGNAAGYRIWNP